MKDVKTRWAVYDDGLKIWFNGVLVAVVEPSEFKHMVSDLALWLRHNDAEDQGDGKFEISLLLTKTRNNGEFYTDKSNFLFL